MKDQWTKQQLREELATAHAIVAKQRELIELLEGDIKKRDLLLRRATDLLDEAPSFSLQQLKTA